MATPRTRSLSEASDVKPFCRSLVVGAVSHKANNLIDQDHRGIQRQGVSFYVDLMKVSKHTGYSEEGERRSGRKPNGIPG
jgi:hypothetical protein